MGWVPVNCPLKQFREGCFSLKVRCLIGHHPRAVSNPGVIDRSDWDAKVLDIHAAHSAVNPHLNAVNPQLSVGQNTPQPPRGYQTPLQTRSGGFQSHGATPSHHPSPSPSFVHHLILVLGTPLASGLSSKGYATCCSTSAKVSSSRSNDTTGVWNLDGFMGFTWRCR